MARLPIGTAIRRIVFAAVIIGAAVWFIFFDTYSVRSRRAWQKELHRLEQENVNLRQEITLLQNELAQPPTDDAIEKIAREEYGMRRPGDVVYQVEHAQSDE